MGVGATPLQRFFDKVDTSGECWEWQGIRTPRGYGFVSRNRTEKAAGLSQRANRYLYQAMNGLFPECLVVKHSCDNPPCVRPDHLSLGTTAENQHEKAARNRSLIGTLNPKAKLTPEQVLDIRDRFDAGEPMRALAREYGVTEGAIWFIGHRRNWRKLPERQSA